MVAVNTSMDLSLTVGRFYLPFNKSTPDEAMFSLPYIDSADRGMNLTPISHVLLTSFTKQSTVLVTLSVYETTPCFNSLPNDKSFDVTKLKPLADDRI